MSRAYCFLLLLLAATPAVAQQTADPVTQALSQGDTYRNKKRYELALESYRKADKLSHHTSALAFLRIAGINRLQGNFPDALDDAKRALKIAGEDKSVAVQAHLFRASLLSSMAGKPTDKKLKEAEEDIRQALALDVASPLAHYNLGLVLLKQERDSDGVAELTAFATMPGADASTVARARWYAANPIRARTPFAPEFSFTTLEKQSISSAGLRGKVVLLDFWGTWCPPCRESVPTLLAINKKYVNKPFQLVGISSDDDEEVWQNYIQAHRMTWAEYIDLSGNVQKAFDVDSYPTYIVLDKDGVVRFRQSGLSNFTGAELEDAINQALKRPSNPALAEAAAGPPPAPPENSAPTSAPSHSAPASEISMSAELSGLEVWTVSGSVYKNRELGLTYEFPQGWVVAQPGPLHAANERTEASARAAMLQQRPDATPLRRIITNKIVLYASRRGEGDGQRMSMPSLRISAVRSPVSSINLSRFGQMAEQMAAGAGAKLLGPPTDFLVKDHQFVRVDLLQGSGKSQFYRAFVQTVAGDYLVSIDLFASSPEELVQLAASLQSITIEESD